MRRSDRVGQRCRRLVGGVVAAVAIGSALSACGVEAGPPGVVGPLGRPAPGTTLDGRRLPKPASNLFPAGELVEYLSIDADHELELVAVDPTTGRVRWRRPAAIGVQPRGVSLSLSGVGRNAAILSRAEGSDRWAVQSIDPSGRLRWESSVAEPMYPPGGCAGRLCVDLSSGVVSFPAAGGPAVKGGRIASDMAVVDADGGWSLVADRGLAGEPAVALLGVPRFHRDGRWHRRLGDVFHGEQVTPSSGWHGQRYGDTWALWLGHVSDVPVGETPDFPYVEPQGSVAAVAVDDGRPLWLRRDIGLCDDLVSERALVLCDAEVRYPAADEFGTQLTSTLERVDPDTGETDFEVELDEPLDLFDTSDRLLRLDGDRWLLRDGDVTRELDLAAGTDTPGSIDTVGWCQQITELDEVRGPGDEDATYRDPGFLHPCTLARDQPARAQLLAPIVDHRLDAPEDSTVAEVGTWVLWVEDGHLAGVATEG